MRMVLEVNRASNQYYNKQHECHFRTVFVKFVNACNVGATVLIAHCLWRKRSGISGFGGDY